MLPRRVFLKSSGLALVAFGALPGVLSRAAAAGARRRRTLVVLFQRGACDALNTVVPYGDAAYASLRPSIAIPAPRVGALDTALDLDGFFGLHPALDTLLPAFRDGTLAVLHAVGSPDGTRSHFDAQDFMESGTPGVKSTEDGWMNRASQAHPDPSAGAFRALALTPTLPRSLAGRASALAVADVTRFGLSRAGGPAAARGFEDMYAAAVGARAGGGAVSASDALRDRGREAFDALELLERAALERHRPAPGADYPRGALGTSLRQVAQLVKANVGLELAFTECGGWDHHAAQGGVQGQLAARLRELGRALAAFRTDLGAHLDDVVLVTLTEFGRTARENGNRGTDHGHAALSLLLGGRVRGGRVYGRWPGLRAEQLHEGRDLALSSDFRDLLAELLARHLGIEALARVFPGHACSPARFPGVLRT